MEEPDELSLPVAVAVAVAAAAAAAAAGDPTSCQAVTRLETTSHT